MSRGDRFREVLEKRAAEAVDEAIEPRPVTGGLRERRIEWLSLGLSVVILGISYIFGGDALRVIFPLAAGGLLLVSAVLQKIIKNWNVSIITWALGAVLTAFGITHTIRLFQPENGFQFIYFLGSLVILAGLLILLQIFRRA